MAQGPWWNEASKPSTCLEKDKEGGGSSLRQELRRTHSAKVILKTPSLMHTPRAAKLEPAYKESCRIKCPLSPVIHSPKVTLGRSLKLSAEENLSPSLLSLQGTGEISPDTACSEGPELSAFPSRSVNKVTSTYPLAPSKLGQLLNV